MSQLLIIADRALPKRAGKVKGTAVDKRAGYEAAGLTQLQVAGVLAGLFYRRDVKGGGRG